MTLTRAPSGDLRVETAEFKRRDGLYVHIPFCSVKCFYCDFTAFSGQSASGDRFVSAVLAEADLRDPFSPETLYLGGGTPTELSASQLEALLSGLNARYRPARGWTEATVEANPESADPEKLAVLRGAGVGRLSFGLQTADDALLGAIGRKHDFAGFVRVYRSARKRGFSLNVDLMLGLPDQEPASVFSSLDAVLALEPDHLSLYSLQVEDRTLFAKRGVGVDEDRARETLAGAMERLAREGFRHYEISNFARPGRESLHNANYWLGGNYLGLGCGAAGYLGGERWQNEERLGRYMTRVESGERPVAHAEILTGKERIGEDLMTGLRLIAGVPLTPAIQSAFGAEIARFAAEGLLEAAGGPGGPVLKLSRRGVFLANTVFREFVAPFEDIA